MKAGLEMDVALVDHDSIEPHLEWSEVVDAIRCGHTLPRASIADNLVLRGRDGLLLRSAWIDGLGSVVKFATVFPGNDDLGIPTIHGNVTLFDDRTGVPDAFLDFHQVTRWKTAADSLLGAQLLARKDSRSVLIIGAGTVARSLVHAYASHFQESRFMVWNRTIARAKDMKAECSSLADIEIVTNIEAAAAEADIICCATMSAKPVLSGRWLKPGQHLDLIGSFRPDTREVDDDAILRSSLFVDSLETTLGKSGEIIIPLEAGVITRDRILGDLYDLVAGRIGRTSRDEITLYKNGGGAHLDLMTARHLLDKWTTVRGKTGARDDC